MTGLCECGCGQATRLENKSGRGTPIGTPRRFATPDCVHRWREELDLLSCAYRTGIIHARRGATRSTNRAAEHGPRVLEAYNRGYDSVVTP